MCSTATASWGPAAQTAGKMDVQCHNVAGERLNYNVTRCIYGTATAPYTSIKDRCMHQALDERAVDPFRLRAAHLKNP